MKTCISTVWALPYVNFLRWQTRTHLHTHTISSAVRVLLSFGNTFTHICKHTVTNMLTFIQRCNLISIHKYSVIDKLSQMQGVIH